MYLSQRPAAIGLSVRLAWAGNKVDAWQGGTGKTNKYMRLHEFFFKPSQTKNTASIYYNYNIKTHKKYCFGTANESAYLSPFLRVAVFASCFERLGQQK